MSLRLRLVDAVIVAAGAMLLLKLAGLATGAAIADARALASSTAKKTFAGALTQARSDPQLADVAATGSTVPGTGQAQEAPAASPQAVSPAERAILERLGERRETLQQKDRDLEMRERLIENAERKLEARINELKALESKVEKAAQGDSPEVGLKTLVTMYETMKPKEAARVFDRLPHDVLVPVVLQMNPRKMAEVLAVMQPEAAERLTVALANRAKGGMENAPRPAPRLPPSELPAIGGTPQARP